MMDCTPTGEGSWKTGPWADWEAERGNCIVTVTYWSDGEFGSPVIEVSGMLPGDDEAEWLILTLEDARRELKARQERYARRPPPSAGS